MGSGWWASTGGFCWPTLPVASAVFSCFFLRRFMRSRIQLRINGVYHTHVQACNISGFTLVGQLYAVTLQGSRLLQLLTLLWSTKFLLPDAKLLYFAPHTTSHFATPGRPSPCLWRGGSHSFCLGEAEVGRRLSAARKAPARRCMKESGIGPLLNQTQSIWVISQWRGHMRKHLLAVLSIFGLAGSSTPASAQVPKNAKPADTKSESTMKKSKLSQEDAASKDARKDKWKAQPVESGQATSDASTQMRKAGGEQNASKQDSSKKVLIGLTQPSKNDADAKMHKAGGEQQEQKAGYMKLEKNKSELKASQGAAEYKGQKATTEKTAVGLES